MAQIRAGHGGGGSPALHGAQRRKGGDTAVPAKRGRLAAATVQPLRQGAGTGPENPRKSAAACRLTIEKEENGRARLRAPLTGTAIGSEPGGRSAAGPPLVMDGAAPDLIG